MDEHEKKERVHRMQLLADEKAQEFHKTFVGKTVQVLFETKHNEVTDGLTDNYIRVYVDSDSVHTGEIYKVYLEKIYKDGLWGKRIVE